MDERKTILDYSPETYERVRQALLHVATVLGEWMEQVTVIGGIVPSLLVPAGLLPEGAEPHPGTADLDLGLQLSVLTDEGYATISELLRQAGYRPVEKEEDRIRRQTWRTDPALGAVVTIDFLIARSPQQAPKTRVQNLEPDFAALIADGLHLVERDKRKIRLSGQTIRGERAERSIWVCGPASFVVRIDSIGPSRAAFFLYGARVAETQDDYDDLAASAHAYVNRLLEALKKLATQPTAP